MKDLLTFRCGGGMRLRRRPDAIQFRRQSPIFSAVFGPPDRPLPLEGNTWMQKLSTLPLLAQPGEDSLYGDRLEHPGGPGSEGSGQSLSRFCEERIFRPLGRRTPRIWCRRPRSNGSRTPIAAKAIGSSSSMSRRPESGAGRPRLSAALPGWYRQSRLSRVRAHVARRRPASGTAPAHARVSRGDEDQSPDCVTASGRGNDSRPRRAGLRHGSCDGAPDRPAAGSFGWIGGSGSSWISDPSKDLTMIR